MRISSRLHHIYCAALVLLSGAGATTAQVPQLLNYQGRIAVNGTNFTGTGQFKFALVDGGTNLTRAASGTELWTGLQADYDLRLVRYEKARIIERDVEPLAAMQLAMA